jgi:hypothetical protein
VRRRTAVGNYTGGGSLALSGSFIRDARLTVPVNLLDCVFQSFRLFRYVDDNSLQQGVYRSYDMQLGLAGC